LLGNEVPPLAGATSGALAAASLEFKRLEAVRRYAILDTPPEEAFDRITRLAAQIFDAPIAVISIVDFGRIWLKSVFGVAAWREVPRENSLSSSVIEGSDPYIIEDAIDESRSQHTADGKEPVSFRFYAGIPLVTKDGYNLGALCVFDVVPRVADPKKVEMLSNLAKIVVDELELRLAARNFAFETSARAAEEHFRLMVDGVKDHAIFMLDVGGNVASWNPGAQRIKGYRSQEILGRHFSAFYPPEDIAAGKPPRELAIAAAEGRVEDEGWRLRRDGTRFWASVVITALRDQDGALRGFGKITRDLTEQRAAGLALRVSEEQFRCSFDEAQIGMLIIGFDGCYKRVNDAFCAIVGYSHEQLAGLSRDTITHPGDVAEDAEELRVLLAGYTTPRAREKRYLHASGDVVWTAIYVSLIRDPEGRPLHLIAQVQDITERRRNERQLEHMADHDPLTGLLNRRSFRRELAGHVARVARYGASGAVLMLDLDNFKYFNDSRGHSAGDELIVRIAQALQSRLRDSDVLARLGGDEFAVLLPCGDEQSTQKAVEALLQVVRNEAAAATAGGQKWVTASAGIALFADGASLTAEEIMVNADLAMYDAKEAGRDRWARYRTEHSDRPKIESRMKWAEQIHDAFASDGFELLAQPIVPLNARGRTQYELLLRMRGRNGDLIPPAAFLHVAERLGLIADIDRWVTRRAIDMLADQRAAGRDLRFGVNLSALSMGDEKLFELIELRLRETGVPPDRLIFEVTETAAVAHVGRAVRFAERLSELGCAFALDDFGAGFGSFYYLKHLPFDYLKIDGEFVQHCAENETDRILISAVVQIARGMGKRTIAEFVTSAETVEVLKHLGVDYGQGFALGRPAPLGEHLSAPNVSAHAQ
jgi:diguanylate cyclase (GGDEF)-like protein/PAS domain S-box-containing protein